MRKFIGILVALVAIPAIARAQALADRVPGDSAIYVAWHGVNDSISGYDQSHLKTLVEASQVSQLIHECIPQMVRKLAAAQDAETSKAADLALALEDAMWKNPTAIYLESVNADGQGCRAAIICQCGALAGDLAAKVNAIKGDMPGAPLCKASQDMFIIESVDGVADAIPASALKGDAQFTAAIGALDKNPFFTVWVNGEQMMDSITHMAATDPQAAAMWPKIRTALGLDRLKSIALTSGFAGKDWSTQALVSYPAPDREIFAMGGEPLTDETIKSIPQSANTAGAFSMDLGGLIPGILSVAKQFDPGTAAQAQQGMQMLTQTLGLDVQRDLFQLFGKQWAIFVDPSRVGFGPMGAVVVNHPSDATKLAASIGKLETFINAILATQMQQQNMTVEFRQFDSGGTQIHYLATPFFAPAWAVKGGALYIGLEPQVVAGVLGKPSDGKSILDNPGFQTMRANLAGPSTISSFSYVDLPTLMPLSYQNCVMGWRLILGAGDLFGLHSPPMVVPPLKVLQAELEPAGAIGWSDDAGLHFKSIEPFPGAKILGAGSNMSAMTLGEMSMMSSVLVPSLNRARGTANAVKSASNLRAIGIGIFMYANDHSNKLPPSLGALVAGGQIDKSQLGIFVSPNGSTNVPANAATMSADDAAAWVDENSDYSYAVSGKIISKLPQQAVLAYEKTASNGKINVLFSDGHVEMLEEDTAQEIIKNGHN